MKRFKIDWCFNEKLTWKGFALGIAVKILFVRYEQKDCNGKPDPCGNAEIKIVI